MAHPLTTWEDFVQLGKTQSEIYLKLNDNRGGTMVDGESYMHLNEGISITYGWHCYNVIKGQESKVSSGPTFNNACTTVIRTWDNTRGDEHPLSVNETIVRDVVHTVTLTTVDSAKIILNRSDIVVDNVASSGKSLTIGSEDNKDATSETSEQIEYTVSITVNAGEKVELLETVIEIGDNAGYDVPYGASSTDDLIGTQGEKFNDLNHWAYSFNSNFGDPTLNIQLKGTSKKTTYTFSLKHTGGTDGAKAKYLSLKGDVLEFISNDGTPKLDYRNARPGI